MSTDRPNLNHAQFIPGQNSMPRMILTSLDGAQAEIYLHGGHLSSWIPAGGSESLFLSRKAIFDPTMPIRGGVPIIFPQFAGYGPLISHGFARSLPWKFDSSYVNGDYASAHFSLCDSPATQAIWPYQFQLNLIITIGGPSLILELHVTNTGKRSFMFTTALHTYFRVQDIHAVTIEGLKDIDYMDQAAGGSLEKQHEHLLKITGEVNRIYYNPRPRIMLSETNESSDSQNQFQINSRGFGDLVVWNPGRERSETIKDLEQDGYRHMVCLEAAVLRKPVRLSAAESWQGSQRITWQPGFRE